MKFHPELMDTVRNTREGNGRKGKETTRKVADELIHMTDTRSRVPALFQTRLEAVDGRVAMRILA